MSRKEYSKEYYLKNKERIALRDNSKKDHKKAYNKNYYNANKERLINYAKAFKRSNRDKTRITQKKYLERNINARLSQSLRCRIIMALKTNARYGKLYDILGCSISDLKTYLESRFTDGMSWDNYGFRGWHIDHIRPCASFDLSDPEQQKECFNYKNLQPLWAKDNLSKNKKYN